MPNHSLRCYELPDLFREAMDRAIDPDTGEITAAGVCEIRALTAAAQTSTADLACYIRELELESDAVQEAVKAMDRRVNRLNATAAKWRGFLMDTLDIAGLSAVKDPRITLTIRTNPPAVRIDDDAVIPPSYCREIPARTEPDKTALKTALKTGETIPGVELVSTRRLAIQ